MNIVRYLFTWESYERNPSMFINELTVISPFIQSWLKEKHMILEAE